MVSTLCKEKNNVFNNIKTEEFTLENRLELLRKSGQISEQVLAETKEVKQIIEDRYKIKLTEERERDRMFVTHVALALQRLINGNEIEKVSPDIIAEVKGYPEEFGFAKDIANKIERKLNVKVPESELAFIAAYLCIFHGKIEPLK